MVLIKNKIQQVESELSLDEASGSYLNTISGNYGISRPVGFTDATWRALTKTLALEYKQITNKFRDVLEILLGPDVTQATNIVRSYTAGTKVLVVNDASKLPQTGILVLDKGTAIQEILEYKFIDYKTNSIFLDARTVYSHQAPANDGETVILKGVAASTQLYAVNTESLPQTGFPFPLAVGRGSPTEETVAVTANNTTRGILTVSALTNTHLKPTVGLTKSSLTRPYAKGSFVLSVADVSRFPEAGVLKLGLPNANWQTSAFHAVSGTTTTITVAANTFSSVDNLSGFYVSVFGPSSGANRGTYRGEFLVRSNTTNVITLAEAMVGAPTSAYTFDVRPVVEYLETYPTDGALGLKYTLPSELPLPTGTEVEFLDDVEVVTTGTVQVLGINWSITQATPHLVEILVPFSEDQLQNLRTASYIHNAVDPTNPADVVATPNTIGSTTLSVADVSDFPLSGQIVINQGGGNEEYASFQKRSNTQLYIPYGLDIAHAGAETVRLWQPAHPSTAVINGDIHGTVPAVWPGPYVYDPDSLAQKSNVITTLAQNLAAPTYLSLGLVAGAGPKAVEVEKAILFPSSGTFQIRVGGTEQMTASAVSLASRCASTVNGAHSAGATTLNVTGGTLAPGGQANFPNANGYRILIGRGTATAEICYVTAINTGGNTITLQTPGLKGARVGGERIELLTDVVTVSQIDSPHVGIVSYTNRTPTSVINVPEAIPVVNYETAEMVEVLYSSIALASGSGFPTTGGEVIVSFGDRIATSTLITAAANSTSFVLQSSDRFPSTGIVEVRAGQRHPVLYTVTANNTGTETLTLLETTKTSLVGKTINLAGGAAESLEYTSRSGSNLSLPVFTPATDHQLGEQVSLSTGFSIPTEDGYSFPLRAPLDDFEKIKYILDLIRAAGVKVEIIRGKAN